MKRRSLLSYTLVLTCAISIMGAGHNIINNTSLVAKAGNTSRQVESLDRGLVAVKNGSGILLSWRLLGTEEYSTTFNVYKDGKKIVEGISENTNYTDTSGSEQNSYYVTSCNSNGEEITKSDIVSPLSNNYLDVAIDKPADGTNKSGSYSYSANDATVADLDGDGEYEIVLKWDPTNSKDNSQSGYTGNVYIDAYEMDGTKLWRVDLGCNIRAGAHYTQFIVYDLNGDGKAEMACKTAYGSKDGAGNYVKESSEGLNQKDYRNSSGYVLDGDEFLTVFEGKTGKNLQTIDYTPKRENVSSWGDKYGNRVDRFLAGVAYLDGEKPSLIMCRGYYTRSVIVAYDWDGKNLSKKWVYDSESSKDTTKTAYGQGAHALSIADTDNDGNDEIVYGSAVIDHDGKLAYSTGHGHGDALHVSDFNNDGEQEVFMVHEGSTEKYGAELRNAKTGKILASVGASGDVGRGVMANITSSKGAEFWSTADSNLYSCTGQNVGARPSSVNFSILWDGDLLSELLDRNIIDKYDESKKSTNRVQTMEGVHSNNSTKATPCLQADIFGDFREEVIMGGENDTYLRIYTTNIETNNKLYTLMHDTQYRCAIAWQNVAYNQPPHTSYYIGEDMSTPTKPSVYTVGSDASVNKDDNNSVNTENKDNNINENAQTDNQNNNSQDSNQANNQSNNQEENSENSIIQDTGSQSNTEVNPSNTDETNVNTKDGDEAYDNVPKTYDKTQLILWCTGALVSFIGILVIRKKNKSQSNQIRYYR